MKTSPATAATAPPTTIQMALSVGEPLKNFDTSELKDVEALMPKASRTMPPTRRAIAIGLFIKFSLWNGELKRLFPADNTDENDDDRDDEQNVNQSSHRRPGHKTEEPEND
jgi:hypothetical protein